MVAQRSIGGRPVGVRRPTSSQHLAVDRACRSDLQGDTSSHIEFEGQICTLTVIAILQNFVIPLGGNPSRIDVQRRIATMWCRRDAA